MVQEEENTVKQFLCKLASIFSVTKNHAQPANTMEEGTGVSKGMMLAWDWLFSLQGHPREVKAL